MESIICPLNIWAGIYGILFSFVFFFLSILPNWQLHWNANNVFNNVDSCEKFVVVVFQASRPILEPTSALAICSRVTSSPVPYNRYLKRYTALLERV